VLQALDSFLESQGFMMPLDLGAKGSCQIGGNLSTNAGGLRLLRYGSLHGSVLGLEAVLANGTVVDCLTGLRKDNTGYDIKQLFIGAEGTLGIITKVAIATPRRPKSVQVAMVACRSFAGVLRAARLAHEELGETLSALEFLDEESMGLVLRETHGARNPLGADGAALHPFYLLVEVSGSVAEHDREKLERFLAAGMEAGDEGVVDGVVAQDQKQTAALWLLREKVPVALGSQSQLHKYDVSLPMAAMYELVEETREVVGRRGVAARVVGYGHLGDGNLHLNVYVPGKHAAPPAPLLTPALEPFVYDWTAARRGSVSAEHGLGKTKAKYIHHSKSAAAVEVMRGLKRLLDPRGILNPYKVLPEP